MRILKTVVVILALSALPLHAAEDTALNQIVDRIVSTESTEMNSFKAYSPLVETYIQNLRVTPHWARFPTATNISWATPCSPRE